MRDIEDFLSDYYRGVYESNIISGTQADVFVSCSGFANVLKEIFKKNFGRGIISFTSQRYERRLIMSIEAQVSFTEDEKEQLSKVSEDAGFTLLIKEDKVEAIFETIRSKILDFHAIKKTIVYKNLVFAFGLNY